MRGEIIKIGNSKGLRIPKSVLEQCGLKDVVELTVKDHTLIIRPYAEARLGWDKAFELMAASGDDTLLDEEDLTHSWDEEEWTW